MMHAAFGVAPGVDHHGTRLELLTVPVPGVVGRPPEASFRAGLDCAALGSADPARWYLHRAAPRADRRVDGRRARNANPPG
jgi:hypothetical protein